VNEPISTTGFVVIGRNEGARLERSLQSALGTSNRVFYADSASTDGSPELAERLGATVIRLPADGRLNAARGRNAGYAELRRHFPDCEFVQFLDGDCILQPQWVTAALEFLNSHPEVAVVCGRRFEAHPEASIYNAMCDREWDTPVGEAMEPGGDALVRCSAFDQVGGYRADLQAGEEPEMAGRMRAAGWRIWRIDASMAEHDAKILSLRQWWRRTQRGGFGYAQVWSATSTLPDRLYARQLYSAFAWAVAVPAAVVILAIVARNPFILIALPLIYVAQLLRIALRDRGPGQWVRATLLLLAKFPEAIGAVRFAFAGSGQKVPEYKS
jgi:glycosyltransferase involved in cell wall biosynthesis